MSNNTPPEIPYDELPRSHSTQPPQVEDVHDEIPPLKPNNWLLPSILATLFCCIFFGIIGIIYATRVDSFYYRGMYAEAEQFAKKARMWTLLAVASLVVNIIFWAILSSTGSLPAYMEYFIEDNASGYNF